jgi:hypothetical protein
MPIKKSSLEQKWYYRTVKTFFLIIPLVIIIFFLLNKNAVVCNVLPVDIFDTLRHGIVYIAVGLILYFLILILIWRIFVYIVFGGIEDDTQRKESGQAQSANQAEPKSVKIVRLIAIIIILSAFAILILSKMGYIAPSGINTDLSGQDIKPTLTPGYTCPVTSAQTATPCHSAKDGVGVSGVIVPDKCNCPSDTKYAQMDNVTVGGPYKICTCK